MSDSEHRAGEPTGVRARVVVVSSSRTEKTDRSGRWIAESLTGAGHQVLSVTLVADDADDIESEVLRAAADGQSQVIILTGGTGVTATDVTPEAVYPLLQRDLPGFGEIFRALSFEEIGPAAMWSRAFAGVAGPLAVFALSLIHI